jgi:hypothetical protein
VSLSVLRIGIQIGVLLLIDTRARIERDISGHC